MKIKFLKRKIILFNLKSKKLSFDNRTYKKKEVLLSTSIEIVSTNIKQLHFKMAKR